MRRSSYLPVGIAAYVALACGSSGSGTAGGLGQGGGDIAAACAQMANLPCSGYQSTAECESEGAADREQAATRGCGSQFDAVASCIASNPPTCSANGDPVFPQACASALQALSKCGTVDGTG